MAEARQVDGQQGGSLHSHVLGTIQRIVREVVGDEFYEVYEIDLSSSFSDDLELESLELVEIAERLMVVYPTADFVGWASGMKLDDLIGVTLADVVDFIVTSLEGSGEHNGG